ncbi:hypothetical protein D3C86_1788270 [compost metagenome]
MGLVDRHERTSALDAARETSPLKGGIGFRHRAKADSQFPREIAMGRQAIASRQSPLGDVVGESKHQPFGGIRLNICKAWSPR